MTEKTFVSNNGMDNVVNRAQVAQRAKQLREMWSLILVCAGTVVACVGAALSPWPWLASVILGGALYHTGTLIGKD